MLVDIWIVPVVCCYKQCSYKHLCVSPGLHVQEFSPDYVHGIGIHESWGMCR